MRNMSIHLRLVSLFYFLFVSFVFAEKASLSSSRQGYPKRPAPDTDPLSRACIELPIIDRSHIG